MKEIFESFLGIFFLALLTMVSISIISSSLDTNNAKSYHTAIIEEIEESNFSPVVMQVLGERAVDQGYKVVYKTYDDAGNRKDFIFNESNISTIGNTDYVNMTEVDLTFDFSFRFVNVICPHTFIGFAR